MRRPASWHTGMCVCPRPPAPGGLRSRQHPTSWWIDSPPAAGSCGGRAACGGGGGARTLVTCRSRGLGGGFDSALPTQHLGQSTTVVVLCAALPAPPTHSAPPPRIVARMASWFWDSRTESTACGRARSVVGCPTFGTPPPTPPPTHPPAHKAARRGRHSCLKLTRLSLWWTSCLADPPPPHPTF